MGTLPLSSLGRPELRCMKLCQQVQVHCLRPQPWPSKVHNLCLLLLPRFDHGSLHPKIPILSLGRPDEEPNLMFPCAHSRPVTSTETCATTEMCSLTVLEGQKARMFLRLVLFQRSSEENPSHAFTSFWSQAAIMALVLLLSSRHSPVSLCCLLSAL